MMKTNLLKSFLLALIVAMLPQLASAYDFIVDGIAYDISFNNTSVSVTSGGNYEGVINIPSSVTYSGKTYTVKTIGYRAFDGCTGLTSVTIPNSVTLIGNSAFYHCDGLTSVNIPNSVTYIGNFAFAWCTSLTHIYSEIEDPSTVTLQGSNIFENVSKFYGKLFVPSGTSDIYRQTDQWKDFSNILEDYFYIDGIMYGLINEDDICASVIETLNSGSIIIPNSISYNGTTYPVTEISDMAFKDCKDLTSVTIPNSVTEIGYKAFYNCTDLTSVNIPNSVTTIANSVFYNCSSLTSIDIPNSVTSIEIYAFQNCSGLTSIDIPNSVTSIGYHAFKDCSGLTSITIGNSVTSIGEGTFSDCNNLTEIHCGITQPIIIDENTFSNYNAALLVPKDAVELYRAADVWKDFTLIAEDGEDYLWPGTTFIVDGIKYEVNNYGTELIVLSNNYSGDIVIPATASYNGACLPVRIIGSYAFKDCTGLTSVTIPNSVTSIGLDAFRNCTGLTSVEIPNSVTSIGFNAFYKCTGLTSVTISNSLTSIESLTFGGCSGLTSVTLPNSLIKIGNYAFHECTGLTSVTIPNSVKTIGGASFWGCTSLTSLNIGDSVTFIGNGAFNGCTSLTSVIIPNSVKYIDQNAFQLCTGLTSLIIGTSVSSIGQWAFRGCSALATIHSWIRNVSINYGSGIFSGVPTSTCALYVPRNCLSSYQSTNPWSEFTNIFETALATDITLNKSELSLEAGSSETLVATVTPSDVNHSVTWTSSNPSVATVDQNGKVTAMRYGSANITAKTADGTNLTASCQVTIFSNEQSTNTVLVGNGTILSEILPICNFLLSTYCGFESIYLKDEMDLNVGDRITSFSFYCAKNSGKGGKFNVRIKETDLTVFQNPETPTDNHSLLTTDDEVYGRVTLGNYSSGNWITFNLDNPYVYKGKNLIVDIRNSEPGNTSLDCYFYCTSAEDKTFYWLQAKNEQASSFYGYNGSSGFHLDDVRPNIRIAFLKGENTIPGDVNGDGVVTAADITALYDCLLNNDTSHIVNGDQTGDGIITAADITAVYSVMLENGK